MCYKFDLVTFPKAQLEYGINIHVTNGSGAIPWRKFIKRLDSNRIRGIQSPATPLCEEETLGQPSSQYPRPLMRILCYVGYEFLDFQSLQTSYVFSQPPKFCAHCFAVTTTTAVVTWGPRNVCYRELRVWVQIVAI